jgi:UDP-glucose 4-epimerase
VAIFCGALREDRELQVFGDGLQTRDYVYVDDIVAALLAAAAAQDSEGSDLAGPFNIGTGVEASVLDLIEHLGTASGLDPEVVHRPERAGEVQRVSLDSTSAGKRLGWTSQTGLADGLGRTYEALAASD